VHTARWKWSFCCRGRNRSRDQLKYDGTCAETRFRLSAKRTSPFKSAGALVQWTTDSRGVRISDSNAGYTMFWGSVMGTGYPLHSSVSPSPPLRHRVPSHFNWSLHLKVLFLHRKGITSRLQRLDSRVLSTGRSPLRFRLYCSTGTPNSCCEVVE